MSDIEGKAARAAARERRQRRGFKSETDPHIIAAEIIEDLQKF